MKMAKKEMEAKEAEEKDKAFDPRKHRLRHGIRHWTKEDEASTGAGPRLA